MSENNEEYIFRVETVPSEELLTEGFRATIFRSWRMALYIVLILVYLAMFGFCLDRAILTIRIGWPAAWVYVVLTAVCLVGAVFMVVRMLTFPKSAARKYMKRMEMLFGDTASLKAVRCFGDKSFSVDGGSMGECIDTDYDQIVAAYETPHAIVLRRKLNMMEVLDKSKIEGGSLEELKAFLKEKLTGAKVHWK